MQVRVDTTVKARNDLVNLLAGRAPGTRADDAARMAEVYLTNIEGILIEFKGEPPGVLRIRGRDGNDRWWEYCNGVWVLYVLEDGASGMLRGRVRTIRIHGFQKELSPPYN